jgi:hypothetical protein
MLACAVWCCEKGRRVGGARLAAAALAKQPDLFEDLDRYPRYEAACCAAQVTLGPGPHDPPTDDAERDRWSRQALEWLEADVAARSQRLASGGPAAQGDPVRAEIVQIASWRKNRNLRGVRDPEHLARLAPDVRARAERFWAHADALVDRLRAAAEAPILPPGETSPAR